VIRSVGFDLDGTLFDHRGAASSGITDLVIEQKWVYDAEVDFGLEWQRFEETHFARYIAGNLTVVGQRRARMRDFLAIAGIELQDGELDVLFEEYLSHYAKSWVPFPDVFPTLEALRGAGFRLAVLTSGVQKQQEAKLTSMGLIDMFDSVLAIGTLSAPKPDPRAFKQLCSVFGDDVHWDAIAATQAGLHGIWLNRDGHDEPAGVRTQIPSLGSLISAIHGWTGEVSAGSNPLNR
jgi:putative hydrolase of the HAD superfamily